MPDPQTISPDARDHQQANNQTLASEKATDRTAHPLLAAHLTSSSSSPLSLGATEGPLAADAGRHPEKEGANQMAMVIGLAQQEQQQPPPLPPPPLPPSQPSMLQNSLAHNHQYKEPLPIQDNLVGASGKPINKRPYSVSPKSGDCYQWQKGDKDILNARDIPLQAPPTDPIHHHDAPTTVNQTTKLIKLDHDPTSPLVLSAPQPPQDSQTALSLSGFRGGRQSSSPRLQQTLTNSVNNGTSEATAETTPIMTNDHYRDQRDRSTTTTPLPPPLATMAMSTISTSQQLDLSDLPIFETLENVRIPAYIIDGEPFLCLPKLLQFMEEKFPLKKMVKKFEEAMIFFSQATYKQVEGFKRLKMIPDSANSCPLIKRSDADRVCLELYEQCHDAKRNDIVDMCIKTGAVASITTTTTTIVAAEMAPSTTATTSTTTANATGSSKQYDQNYDSKQQIVTRQDPSITGIINISSGDEQVGCDNRSQSDNKDEQVLPICMVRQKVCSQSAGSIENSSSSSSLSSSLSSSTSSLSSDRPQQLERLPTYNRNKCNNSEKEKWILDPHGSETSLKQPQTGLIFETNEAQKSILALARAVSSTLMIRVYHKCFGKCGGLFYPSLLVTSKSQCIECINCHVMLAPRRFIGHTHGPKENGVCHWGFNSLNWRYYIRLSKKQNMNNLDDEELVLQFKILQSVPDDAQANEEDDNVETNAQQFDSKEFDNLNLKFHQQTTTSLSGKDGDSNCKSVDKDHFQQQSSIFNCNERSGNKSSSMLSPAATLPMTTSVSFDEKSWNLSQQFLQQQSNYLLNALSSTSAANASTAASSASIYRHNINSPFLDSSSSCLPAAPNYHSLLSMTTPSYCTRTSVNPYYTLPTTTLAQECYKIAENYGFGQQHQLSRTSSLGMDPRRRYGSTVGGSGGSSGSSSNGSGITANTTGISHRNLLDIMSSLPMDSSTSHHHLAGNWLPSSRPLSVADSDLTSMGPAHAAYNTLQFEKELKREMFVSSSLNTYLNELGISSSVASDIVSHTLNSMRKSKLLF